MRRSVIFIQGFRIIQIGFSQTIDRESQITPISGIGILCMIVKAMTHVTGFRIVMTGSRAGVSVKPKYRVHPVPGPISPPIGTPEYSCIKTGFPVFEHITVRSVRYVITMYRIYKSRSSRFNITGSGINNRSSVSIVTGNRITAV